MTRIIFALCSGLSGAVSSTHAEDALGLLAQERRAGFVEAQVLGHQLAERGVQVCDPITGTPQVLRV